MSAKKKRPKKPSGNEPKKAEAPFFRPFSNISVPAPRKDVESSKTSQHPANKPATQLGQPPSPKQPTHVSPKPPRHPPQPDPDDMLTFERFMAGVEPLENNRARRVSTTQGDVDSTLASRARQIAQQQQAADREALDKLHSLVEDASRFEIADDGRRIEGRRRGVDGGLVRRMRQGELAVDATLDLNGMRVDDARLAVETFVRDRRTKGDRVVLIVHGRGSDSSSQQPVLRGEVAAWLSEGKASKHVSAFLTSPPECGGEGTMSVLLAQPSERHRGMP